MSLLGLSSFASVRKALLDFVGRCNAEGFKVQVSKSAGRVMTDELQNSDVLANPPGAVSLE